MSGVDLDGKCSIRKGSCDRYAIRKFIWTANSGSSLPSADAIKDSSRRHRAQGRHTTGRWREGSRALGVIELKDIVKGGIRERFAELRRMGIRTIMITGDNPLTAASIAAEAGVDDYLAEATPEAKLKLIRDIQAEGRLVAMCGDGTNDAPALAQADVAVAMNSGTQAAKEEAGNMVDLDSNPTKLIEVVEIGKQMLITRGALTTFSYRERCRAKYFAIIPAAFASTYPALNALNVMHLATPQSAILSAVIFNAIIIIVLIPLALRGVRYRARPVRIGRAVAPQSSDVRRQRDFSRAVCRHQAHRCVAGPRPAGLKENLHAYSFATNVLPRRPQSKRTPAPQPTTTTAFAPEHSQQPPRTLVVVARSCRAIRQRRERRLLPRRIRRHLGNCFSKRGFCRNESICSHAAAMRTRRLLAGAAIVLALRPDAHRARS